MRVTQRVKKLLSLYESDNPGTKTNLARILMEGRLSGSGRVMVLPIDGSARNFLEYPAGYDPQYHFQLAVDAGLSALAAPLGMLETGADTFAGAIPLILKMNSATMSSFNGKSNHGIIGSVRDALRLGCVGIGCTVHPGDKNGNLEEVRAMVEEAKSYGLAVVLWSSPGGESEEDETALDNTAYAGHLASLMGAHMICVRIPGSHLHHTEPTVATAQRPLIGGTSTLSDRVRHVRQSCLNGRRIVLFEGNQLKSDEDVFDDIRGIRDGGGHGYVLPYNSLYRQFEPALQMLDQSLKIYQGKA